MAIAIIIFILCLTTIEASSSPTCTVDTSEIDRMVDSTKSSLESKGYSVVEGTFKVVPSNSYGANPGNPYVTYYHPGLIDSRYPIFTMKENSAVIFVGCTPSTTSYFSFRSYAFFSRHELVFASLGDSLNNLVINTTSTDGNTGGQLTSVITTADATMYQELTNVLSENGVTATNLDAIPSSLLDMDETQFIMLHRASVWGSESEKKAYFAQTRRVLFVNAPKTSKQNPLPVLPLRKVGDGVTELSMPKLKENLDTLHNSVLSEMESLGYTLLQESTVYDLGLDGFQCLKTGKNCKGDNRDTHYLAYHDLSFEEDDVYVIYGTNNVETSKCTYVNIGLYQVHKRKLLNLTKLTSTNLTVDNRGFVGSSATHGVHNDDRVFAYSLKRSCEGESFCLEVDTTNVPKRTMWALAYRTYLEPTTATGPKLDEIVLPTVLKFRKKR